MGMLLRQRGDGNRFFKNLFKVGAETVARSGFGNTRTGFGGRGFCLPATWFADDVQLREPRSPHLSCLLGCGYKIVSIDILWKRQMDADDKLHFKAALASSLLLRL